jgi:tripartite-type tricarboxylate transporter receptor subunit TctC
LTASQLKNLQFHRSLRDCHTHVLRLCFAGVQRRHRALAEQGRLKVIGQLGAQRSELLKNVPAVSKELKNFSYKIWSVLMVPSNTPGNVVQRLHKAIGATLQDPSVRSQLAAQTQLTSAPMSVAESINLLLQ